MPRLGAGEAAETLAACSQWMPTGFLNRGSSWKRMTTKSRVSSIWAVAWAKRASSRSSGGRASRPGRPGQEGDQGRHRGPRQPRLQRASSRLQRHARGDSTILSLRQPFPLWEADGHGPRSPDISVVVPVFDEEGAAPAPGPRDRRRVRGAQFRDRLRGRRQPRRHPRRAEGARRARSRNCGCWATARTPARAGRSAPASWRRAGRSSSPWTATARTIRPTGRRLVDALLAGPPELALVGGERVKRQDSPAKKVASRIGNGVRKRLLRDTANDTGCGLKAFRREAFLRLPYFDHIHRYLPALMQREGYEAAFRPGEPSPPPDRRARSTPTWAGSGPRCRTCSA